MQPRSSEEADREVREGWNWDKKEMDKKKNKRPGWSWLEVNNVTAVREQQKLFVHEPNAFCLQNWLTPFQFRIHSQTAIAVPMEGGI